MTSSTIILTLVIRSRKSFLKGMPGTDNFMSILNLMSMKLHSKLGSCLKIKTKVLKTLEGSML